MTRRLGRTGWQFAVTEPAEGGPQDATQGKIYE